MFVEPAADALPLKPAMQPIGKRLVLVAVADEAGIELSRLIEKRGQRLDELFRKAAIAKEGIRNSACRPVKSVDADGGGREREGLRESNCSAQVNVGESSGTKPASLKRPR